MIDLSTQFGQRVSKRLNKESIIWLITVSQDGFPQPRPVWFLWNGDSFLIFSRPEGAKLRHIQRNPQVALHLDSDSHGGNIVVLLGTAEIVTSCLPSDDIQAYLAKYAKGIASLGMTAEHFSQSYSTALRVTPTSLRGH
jgi:PPOX class probable F420-dependent enzyme